MAKVDNTDLMAAKAAHAFMGEFRVANRAHEHCVHRGLYRHTDCCKRRRPVPVARNRF